MISLLALNGLRVSEAIGAEIEALGVKLDHRTLAIVRKGGKTVTIPPRPAPPAQLTWPSATRRRADLHLPATAAVSTGMGRLVSSAARSLDRHATCIVSTYIAGAAR